MTDWERLALVAVWIVLPILIGIVVGEFYRARLCSELAEAKRLARQMYLELDDVHYELEQVQETLDRAEGGPPTDELQPVRPAPDGGRHRLRE